MAIDKNNVYIQVKFTRKEREQLQDLASSIGANSVSKMLYDFIKKECETGYDIELDKE